MARVGTSESLLRRHLWEVIFTFVFHTTVMSLDGFAPMRTANTSTSIFRQK